jgi:adenylate kinase family enzyme
MESYHKQTAPVVSYYKKQGILTTIDAAMKPNEVYAQMRKVIKKPVHHQ